MPRRSFHAVIGAFAMASVASFVLMPLSGWAEVVPSPGASDSRIRAALYSTDQVYRLYGFIGYQIDLEFESGEHFVGLGAGDIEGISFVAEDNHLFLKPKATQVGTNLTVLTTRRQYQLDYTASAERPSQTAKPVIYAVRFTYPAKPAADSAARIDRQLAEGTEERTRNFDYWFCGKPTLKPAAVSDDGVHTFIRFGPKGELPAIFVGNEDGTESLLNFSVESGEIVIHRVAPRFILRRGRLTGCIVNKGYGGSGEHLPTGTVADGVERDVRGARP